MIINLTDLAAARAKMTPGDMAHRQIRDDGDLIFDGVYAGDGNSVAYDEVGDDAGWDPHNAAGIVAEHNAIGVLIEVARAARCVQALGWDFRSTALDQLLAALAKVSL